MEPPFLGMLRRRREMARESGHACEVRRLDREIERREDKILRPELYDETAAAGARAELESQC